jgi:serine/threonine-protein kinase
VIGQSFENASLALEELDFAVVRIDVESNHPAGEVVGQSPEGGALQPPGTTITLSVSKGSSAMTMVPDVTGRTEGDARARLESDGFIMSISGGVICDSNQKIVVTTQDPSGGTQAIPGSTVKVALGCA